MTNATDRLSALTAAVTATNDQLDKVKGEITSAADAVAQELAGLREQIANGTVTEESLAAAEAAVSTLREKTQTLDDLHTDPENPVEPGTETPAVEPGTEAPVSEPGTENPTNDGFTS